MSASESVRDYCDSRVEYFLAKSRAIAIAERTNPFHKDTKKAKREMELAWDKMKTAYSNMSEIDQELFGHHREDMKEWSKYDGFPL